VLDSADVLAVMGEFEAGGMPEHVWIDRHAQLDRVARTSEQLTEGGGDSPASFSTRRLASPPTSWRGSTRRRPSSRRGIGPRWAWPWARCWTHGAIALLEAVGLQPTGLSHGPGAVPRGGLSSAAHTRSRGVRC
jgi:hypothetical protein